MLFRADFVRQKHVPGSIETNHGSLSKIIGNCWKALPLEEKRVWEVKAKHAKAEHKVRYPEYRFRPVHNKNKDKKKEKPAPSAEDERRCEEVAQLLLEGKKGDELAAAVRSLDRKRDHDDPPRHHYHPNPLPPHPVRGHRRSSSVPLPTDYSTFMAVPTLPFLTLSRPDSPVGNISRSTRIMLGQRRASSARPSVARAWTWPAMPPIQHDNEPLPDVDTSLFEQSFLESNFSFSGGHDPSFNLNDVLTSLPPHATHRDLPHLGPLDGIAPHHLHMHQQHHYDLQSPTSALSAPELDPHTWLPLDLDPHAVPPSSYSSSTNSASPDSQHGLPLPSASVVVAPQPQPHHAYGPPRFSVIWKELTQSFEDGQPGVYEYGQNEPAHSEAVYHPLLGEMDVQFQQQQHEPMPEYHHHHQPAPMGDYGAGLFVDGNVACGSSPDGMIAHQDEEMNYGFEFGAGGGAVVQA
jgi:hypothetical protein